MLTVVSLLYFIVFVDKAATEAQDAPFEPGTIVLDRVGIEMVYIPAASFVIGIDPVRLRELCEIRGESDADRCIEFIEEDTGATYTYTVDIPQFWIDRYEITIAEFNKHCIASFDVLAEPCGDAISSYRPELVENPQQPRVGISWERAMIFCAARGTRLPTEAEWEYAASGPDKLFFPWGNEFNPDYLHSSEDVYPPTTTYPVGSVPQNQSWIGVYDMAGNAAEWVEDRFLPRFLTSLTLDEVPISVRSHDAEIRRVTRGGSSDGRPWPMTTFYRESERQTVGSEYIGFRCARSTPPGQ